MLLRLTRRKFVGWLVRASSAAVASSLLPLSSPRHVQAAPHPPAPSPYRGRGGDGV